MPTMGRFAYSFCSWNVTLSDSWSSGAAHFLFYLVLSVYDPLTSVTQYSIYFQHQQLELSFACFDIQNSQEFEISFMLTIFIPKDFATTYNPKRLAYSKALTAF